MIFGSYSPTWFLGFDSILEGFFLVILLIIAWYSRRIYNFGGGKQFYRWSIAFFLIAAAYGVNALTNLALYRELIKHQAASLSVQVVALSEVYQAGMFLHIILFLLGYLGIAMVTLHIEDKRVASLFVALAVLLSVAGTIVPRIFKVTVIIFLLAIIGVNLQRHTPKMKGKEGAILIGYMLVIAAQAVFMYISSQHMWDHYLHYLGLHAAITFGLLVVLFLLLRIVAKKMVNRLLVLLGFVTLLVAQIVYMFPTWQTSYVVGHYIELLGYGLLLVSMLSILRRD